MDIRTISLEGLKERDKVKCICAVCKSNFETTKNHISALIRKGKFEVCCSRTCGFSNMRQRATVKSTCPNCGVPIESKKGDIRKTRKGKCFCSKSCSAHYNNVNKTWWSSRSKLEVYIENNINSQYQILYGDRKTIGLEMDMYIPELKLGIEFNGILHYYPIYGDKNFQRIQRTDKRKIELCKEYGIKLVVINLSSWGNFSVKKGEKMLLNIKNIINES